MPPAARVTDMHVCPMVTPGVPPIPHVGGPILPPGCPTVLIGFLPAARVGDMAVCVGPPDVIVLGSMTVLIGSMPAARIGDLTAHGGNIVMGEMTVMIGDTGHGSAGGGGAGISGSSSAAAPAIGGPGPGMAQDLATAFTLAGPVAAAFTNAAESGAPLVCKGPCEACAEAGALPPPPAAPQETKVVGHPAAIDADANSIICKAGVLVVQNNNTGPDKSCTEAHESSHIADWKGRYGNDLCKGVPDGSLPVGGDGYDEFLNKSECKAYKVGKACREKLLKKAAAGDKTAIQDAIDRDDDQISNYCG
jgi:uncharacterized Zn-binding protein involved in type VI secretion